MYRVKMPISSASQKWFCNGCQFWWMAPIINWLMVALVLPGNSCSKHVNYPHARKMHVMYGHVARGSCSAVAIREQSLLFQQKSKEIMHWSACPEHAWLLKFRGKHSNEQRNNILREVMAALVTEFHRVVQTGSRRPRLWFSTLDAIKAMKQCEFSTSWIRL